MPGSPSPSPTPASTPSRAPSPASTGGHTAAARARTPANGSEPPPAGASRLPHPTRLDAHYFPIHEFSLSRSFENDGSARTQASDAAGGELSLAQLAFQRGQVPPGERAESPADGPLRHVSVPPGLVAGSSAGDASAGGATDEDAEEDREAEEGTGPAERSEQTSTRKGKRSRAAGGSSAAPVPSPNKKRRIAATSVNTSPSPRKRARAAAKGGETPAEESDLSELSEDEDDDVKEEAEGSAQEGGAAREGRAAEDEQDDDDDGKGEESDGGETVADDDDDDFAPQALTSKGTRHFRESLAWKRHRTHLGALGLAATKKKGTGTVSSRRQAAPAETPDVAASRSASPGAAATAASPVKTTRAGAAARAKAEREKSESSATPRSSGRRSGAATAHKVRLAVSV